MSYVRAMEMLYANRNKLTRQQVKTIHGQIRSGQSDAAMKGMHKLFRQHEEALRVSAAALAERGIYRAP